MLEHVKNINSEYYIIISQEIVIKNIFLIKLKCLMVDILKNLQQIVIKIYVLIKYKCLIVDILKILRLIVIKNICFIK